MRPFATREEALNYFIRNNPYSKCDFVLIIESPISNLDVYFALSNFSFPELGVTYSNEFGFPHPTPKSNFGPMDVQYYQRKVDNVIMMDQQKNFNQLWADQFSADGTLYFIPSKDRPKTYIYTFNARPQLLVQLDGCVFTYPKPDIDYGSAGASVFRLSISYEDCTIWSLLPGDSIDGYKIRKLMDKYKDDSLILQGIRL